MHRESTNLSHSEVQKMYLYLYGLCRCWDSTKIEFLSDGRFVLDTMGGRRFQVLQGVVRTKVVMLM